MTRLWTLQVVGILVAALACITTTGAVSTSAGDMATEVNDMTIEMELTTIIEMTTEIELTTIIDVDVTTTMPSEVTTSAPEARWSVRDKDGNLCMLMDFDGTIGFSDKKNETYDIPSFASTSRSDCSSSSFATFALEFSSWKIYLNFTTRGRSYQLHKISVYYSEGGFNSSVTQDFFDVPLGHYYTCKNFKQSVGGLFEVNLIKPSFQPFVQKTEGGDNLGKAHVCHHGTNRSVVIGIIIAVIVIIVAIAVTWYVVKRRGNTHHPYSRVSVQAAI